MNENINLFEILKNCSIGTKLYSPIFGEVELGYLDSANDLIYVLYASNEYEMKSAYFQIDGTYINSTYGETMLFPSKDQRDWGKFKVPVKRFDPKTFQPFDKVLVRDYDEDIWRIDMFSDIYHGARKDSMRCIGRNWYQCIPYDDETKHLLGTTDDCQEYYKWWKD